jgi:hypothetical protein
MAAGAAVGLVPHTGWAWLVRVEGAPASARVDARARVEACPVLDGQLYHLAAERARDRERFVASRRSAALARTCEALAPHLRGAAAAVILGKVTALPPVDRVVAAHPMIHAAEGELWRALFAEACAAGGLAVARSLATDVRTSLAQQLRPADIDRFLAAGKRAVGPPWGREQQDAALAAWAALR